MTPPALPDNPRAWLLPALAGAVLAGLAMAATAAVGPFAPPPTDAEPTLTALEVTERGCRGDLREFSRTSDGPNGTVEVSGTVETASPRTELTAAAVRTSPAESPFATSRVELHTDEPPGEPRCAGQVAYRVVVRAPTGPRGFQVLVTLDGRPTACSASATGNWETRCGSLLSPETWPSASTNGSVTG